MKKLIVSALILLFLAPASFAAEIIGYEYDDLGRVIKTIYDDGSCMVTSYFGTTNYKYLDMFFSDNGKWQKTLEYYGKLTNNKQPRRRAWIADINPTTPGDIVYIEYRSEETWFPEGHNIALTIFDTGGCMITTYRYGNHTSEKYEDEYYDANGMWQKTIGYYERWINYTDIKHYMWLADPDFNNNGDVIRYEYENTYLNRVVQKTLDTGDFIRIQYWWSNTTSVKCETFFAASGIWQKTVEYYENGVTMHQQWIADARPSVLGDVVYYSYDAQGRMTQRALDTGESVATDYWGTANSKKHDYYFSAAGVWQTTAEYYENGVTKHRQWMADTDPVHTGNVVYEEYDRSGMCIFRTFDDGSAWTPARLNAKSLLIQAQGKEVDAVIGINSTQKKQLTIHGIVISPQMAGADSDKYGKPLR